MAGSLWLSPGCRSCPAAPFEAAFLIAAQLGDATPPEPYRSTRSRLTRCRCPLRVRGRRGFGLDAQGSRCRLPSSQAKARVDEARKRTMHFGDERPFDLLPWSPARAPPPRGQRVSAIEVDTRRPALSTSADGGPSAIRPC